MRLTREEFYSKYPNVKVSEHFGIQDAYYMRLEATVPDATIIESDREFASDASYQLGYFGGIMVGKEPIKEGGTLYRIDGWKD